MSGAAARTGNDKNKENEKDNNVDKQWAFENIDVKLYKEIQYPMTVYRALRVWKISRSLIVLV